MVDVETKLYYGQKVYVAMPQCACSENVHELKYTKLAGGYVRKYNPETDTYMVEISETNDRTVVTNYCPCESYDVGHDSNKVVLKEVQSRQLFVLNLPEREYGYKDIWLKTGDIINIYPYSGKYKILAFNNIFSMILVADVAGITATGAASFAIMKVVDLLAEDTFVSQGDGIPVIPYVYEMMEVEDIPEEPTETEDGD